MNHINIKTSTNELLMIRALAVKVITKVDDLLKVPENFDAKSSPVQDRALARNFVGHGFAGHM
jgi:hypothetical protein